MVAYRKTLVTGPTIEPVTLAETRRFLKMAENSDNDAVITSLITAARAYVEATYDAALIPQTWDFYLDNFKGRDVTIRMQPVQSVTYVKYYSNDALTTFASSNYHVDISGLVSRIVLADGASWPSHDTRANAIVIRVVGGYVGTDTDTTPQFTSEHQKSLFIMENGVVLSTGQYTVNAAANTITLGFDPVPFGTYRVVYWKLQSTGTVLVVGGEVAASAMVGRVIDCTTLGFTLLTVNNVQSTVPQNIKTAIMLLVAMWHENREDMPLSGNGHRAASSLLRNNFAWLP